MRIAVIKLLLADRSVCRMELAFSGFNLAEYGVWVSVLIYAYERGGALETAAAAVAQLLPAGLLAPVLARAVDRRGAACTLRRGYWWQAGALATTAALLLSGAPGLLVYAAAIVAASAVTMTRPAQAALAPRLVHGSEQLTAINVLSGWVESAGVLLGPALAGLLIALNGPGAAVGFFALCVAASALVVGCLAGVDAERAPSVAAGAPPAAKADLFDARRENRGLDAVIALLAAQYFVIGALDVLLVVLALGDLELGPSGPGYLNAAFGAGGVIGSLVACSLIGRLRLAGPAITAAIGWAGVLIVLGTWPTAVGAFLLLTAAGTMRSVLDVSGRTMLLRAAPAAIRGRVFGLLEGAAMIGLALGSLLVPLLVAFGGVGTGLVIIGALLSAVAFLAAARLHRVDRLTAIHDSPPVPATIYALTS